jgi:ribonuclease R
VSGVTPFGIFVQLDQLYIEGLVHVTELGQDYFQYDEARHELRGERTGKRFGLTDRVKVKVARVDLEARKIDLVLADADTGMPVDRVRAKATPVAPEGKPGKPSRRARKAELEVPSDNVPDLGGEEDFQFVTAPPPRRVRTSKTTSASAKNSAKKAAPKKADKPVSKTSRKKK